MAACFNKEVPWSRRGQRKLRRHPFRRRPISGLKPREPGNLLVLTPRWHLLAGGIKVCPLVVCDATEADVTKTPPYSCEQIPTASTEL